MYSVQFLVDHLVRNRTGDRSHATVGNVSFGVVFGAGQVFKMAAFGVQSPGVVE